MNQAVAAQQTLFVPLVHRFQIRLVFRLHRAVRHRAVSLDAEGVQHAECGQEVRQSPAVKGNLVREAVAVGVLRLERRQHLVPLVDGHRRSQPQLLQPVVADNQPVVAIAADFLHRLHRVDAWEVVHLAVRRLHLLAQFRALGVDAGQVGRVLGNQVGQVDNQPFGVHPVHAHVVIPHDDIRQIARNHHHLIRILRVVRRRLERHIHPCGILNHLNAFERIIEVDIIRPQIPRNRHFRLLLLRRAAAKQTERQNQAEQCSPFPHGAIPFPLVHMCTHVYVYHTMNTDIYKGLGGKFFIKNGESPAARRPP